MRASHAEKSAQVEELVSKIDSTNAAIFVDYKGLTVTQLTELRGALREVDGEFEVIKNNLSKRAMSSKGFTDLSEQATEQNAIVFAHEEPYAVIKAVYNFMNENEALTLKAGVVNGEELSTEGVNEIAVLPTKDELLATFASMLQTPIRNIAYGLTQIEAE